MSSSSNIFSQLSTRRGRALIFKSIRSFFRFVHIKKLGVIIFFAAVVAIFVLHLGISVRTANYAYKNFLPFRASANDKISKINFKSGDGNINNEENFHPDVKVEIARKLINSSIIVNPTKKKLHGIFGRNEQGDPIWTSKPLTFKQSFEQKVEAHTGYCFNRRVSESLSLDRDIPNYNSRQCLAEDYDLDKLPSASVIIVFYNEDLSVLLRSFHSVLNRTPPQLLHEVILVDDYSNSTTHPWLGADLDNYLLHTPKVVLRRLPHRHGLMMARMAGVEWASAPINVFLDSHIEATDRWLEPLIAAVHKNPKDIVVPFIHTIDADNFNFESSYLSVLGFSWSLGQTHPWRPSSDYAPMRSPVMAGGLFAINKQWFLDLGGYDKEMRLYGGEEMEIGFKTWMCGGELHALPCARVGHVFRTGEYWKHQVYTVPGEEIHRNKLRAAAVWMDEYEKIVRIAIPKLPPPLTLGPLDEAKAVRERLSCKSFDWYLKNVFPELKVPIVNGGKVGAIRSVAHNACLDSLMLKNENEIVGAYPCHNQHGTQAILHDARGGIRLGDTNFELCIRAGSNEKNFLGGGQPNIVTATKDCDNTQWLYDDNSMQLVSNSTISSDKQCLQVLKKETSKSPFDLQVVTCDPESKYQKFGYDLLEF